MIDLKLKKQLNIIGGLFAVMLYCAFTFSSIPFYPPPFSPITHWLSDLGNPTKNPDGAILYNLGCILTGVALIPFFIGMGVYKEQLNQKWQIIALVCQITGFFELISLIGVGIFPGGVSDSIDDMHNLFSNLVFYSNMLLLIILGVLMIKHPKATKWIGIYNFLAAGINVFFLFIPFASKLMEWLTVFTALGFILFISINTAVRIQKKTKLI